jgi:hypothetical protein
LKPITGDSKIKLNISNIKNTSTLWSGFSKKTNYISMTDTGVIIKNLHYWPALNLKLK